MVVVSWWSYSPFSASEGGELIRIAHTLHNSYRTNHLNCCQTLRKFFSLLLHCEQPPIELSVAEVIFHPCLTAAAAASVLCIRAIARHYDIYTGIVYQIMNKMVTHLCAHLSRSQVYSPLKTLLQPSANEILKAIRALFLQVNSMRWHSLNSIYGDIHTST